MMRNQGGLSGSGDDIFVSNEEKEDDGFEFPRRNVRFSSPEEASRGVPRFQRVDSIAVNKARMMRNRGGLSRGVAMTFLFQTRRRMTGSSFRGATCAFFAGGGARGVPRFQRVDSIAVNKARMIRNRVV